MADGDAQPPELYEHDPEEESRQIERLQDVISRRDASEAERSLEAIRTTAAGEENLMPAVLAASRAHATEGEIMGAFRDVYGEYRDPGVF